MKTKDVILNTLKEVILRYRGTQINSPEYGTPITLFRFVDDENQINSNADLSFDLGFDLEEIAFLLKESARKLEISVTEDLMDYRFENIGELVDFLDYKANHKRTILNQKLEDLFNPSNIGITLERFCPFYIQDYNTLDAKTRNDIANGQKCVWTKLSHPMFEALVQLTFRGENSSCFLVYVGFTMFSVCIFANMTEYYQKVIQDYGTGAWWDSNVSLRAESATSKVPIFSKVFQERQQIGKPYFMTESGQILLTQQIKGDDIQTDKDFYNAIGGTVKICQCIMNEIKRGKVGEYSFTKDLMAALKLYLRMS